MKKFKKILAFFAVLTSLALSIFLIRDAVNNKAVSQFADLGQNAPVENFPLLNIDFKNTITGAYIQKLTESLQAANPNGFAIIDSNLAPAVPNVASINQWLEANAITIDSLKPNIGDKDLLVSEDQNAEAVADYVTQYNLIFEKHFGSLPANINLNVETSSFNDFIKLLGWVSEQYKKINKDLIILVTPKNILNLHKGLIQNNGAEAAIYDIVVNSQKDPVKTMMVMPLREEIVKEKQAIRTSLANLLKNLNTSVAPTN